MAVRVDKGSEDRHALLERDDERNVVQYSQAWADERQLTLRDSGPGATRGRQMIRYIQVRILIQEVYWGV
jgi:hypothetical protein